RIVTRTEAVAELESRVATLGPPGEHLIFAFYAFLVSLVAMIAITDGVLEVYSTSLAAKVIDASLSASPFFVGLDYLYLGAKGIHARFGSSVRNAANPP